MTEYSEWQVEAARSAIAKMERTENEHCPQCGGAPVGRGLYGPGDTCSASCAIVSRSLDALEHAIVLAEREHGPLSSTDIREALCDLAEALGVEGEPDRPGIAKAESELVRDFERATGGTPQ